MLSTAVRTVCVTVATLVLSLSPALAQLEDAPVGVAVKISARGEGSSGYIQLNGTFLPSSPTANDGYASNSAYSSGSYATAVLGAQGYVRVEPGKSYTVSASSSSLTSCAVNIVAPPGYRVVMDQMVRSREPFNGSANIVFQVRSPGTVHPGLAGLSTSVASTEVEWRLSLGSLRNGASAGELALIDTGTRTDWAPLFTPGALFYETTSDEVSVHRPSNILRQVRANQVTVDIVTLTPTSYEIRCYHPSQVQGSSFPYTFTGQPYVTYKIEQGSSATAIKFTKEVRNVVNATATNLPVARKEVMTLARTGTWPAVSWTRTGWTLDGAAAVAETSVVSTGTSAARSETITVRKPNNGAVALKVTRSYETPLVNTVAVVGEVMTSETVGTGTGLTSSFTYYTQPAQFGSFGYVKSATLPGGKWAAYEYYDATAAGGYRGGRVKYQYRPYLDAPATAAWDKAQGEVTYYEYVDDVFGAPTRVSLAETKVNNTLAAKSTTAFNDSYGNANGFALTQSTQTDSSSGSQSLQTITRFYKDDVSDAFIRGQTYSITKPDGVKQSFGYQHGTWSSDTFTAGSGAIGAGTASRIVVVTGSSNSAAGSSCPNLDSYVFDSVYLVDGKSTMEVTIRDERALVVRTESRIWKNSGWQTVSWTKYEYDFGGRLTTRTSSNGKIYAATYDGGLKVSETDEAGVLTNYTYTAAGQVDVMTRTGTGVIPAVATTYVYDAAGQVLDEKVGSGTEKIITSRTYDDAGRVATETPPGLGTITHSYNLTERTHTVTKPSPGGTVVEKTYRDGRPHSTTGTAVVANYHTYGVETASGTSGQRWHQVNTGTANSPRWVKSWTDWLGREVKTEAPSFTGIANAVAESFYENGTGRLTKTTKSGYAPTLYEYNYLGQVKRSGLDVNNDGLLQLASTDRISETESYLESFNSTWWMRTDTRTYPKAGVGTSQLTAISRTRLTGHPANRVAESQSVDVEGNVTKQYVDVNRTAKTAKTTTQKTGISGSQVEESVNGMPVSVTGFDGLTTSTTYDALLRVWKVEDVRGNTTTTTYVAGTKLVSTVTNAAGNQSANHYDTLGRVLWQRDPLNHYTRFGYNTRDQVEHQWGDGTTPVSYTYDPDYGERVTMSTYRGGTGFDGETWPTTPGTADTTTWTFDGPSGLLWKKTDAATDEHPNGTTVVQTYNVRRQTATRTLARGVTTTYSYDASTGELLTQTYSDSTPSVTYTYGRAGQVETVSDFTGVRDLIYDANKPWRLSAEAHDSFYGNRVMTRLYDDKTLFGRVRGFKLGPTVGSGAELEQTFGFTSVGRFETVTTASSALGSPRTFKYTYRTDSPLIASLSIVDEAFTVTRGYEDERNLVTSIEAQWSTESRSRYDYAYDERGFRKSVVQSGAAFADYGESTHRIFTYDGKGQVTADAGFMGGTATDQSRPMSGRRHAFDYDNAGNRKWSDRAGVDPDNDGLPDLRDRYETNALNQYTTRENHTIPVSGTAAPESTPAGGEGGTAVAVAGRTAAAGRQARYFADEMIVSNVQGAWRGPVTIFTATRGSNGAADSYRIDTRMAEIATMLQAFSYDDDGNLLSDGLVDYQWDAENRLVRMETTAEARNAGFPHKLLEFRYDYMGRRVQKRVVDMTHNDELYTRRFLYDGWNLVAEYTMTPSATTLSLQRSYTWGLDIVSTLADAGGVGALLQIADHPNGKTYLPTYDGNGNIVSLVNGTSGALAAIYEYGPFGESLRAETRDTVVADQPFRFSTKYTDVETGLVYYGHRYYSTSLGRFINRDPIEESGGLNLYAFCGNNGVNRRDYLGMDDQIVTDGGAYKEEGTGYSQRQGGFLEVPGAAVMYYFDGSFRGMVAVEVGSASEFKGSDQKAAPSNAGGQFVSYGGFVDAETGQVFGSESDLIPVTVANPIGMTFDSQFGHADLSLLGDVASSTGQVSVNTTGPSGSGPTNAADLVGPAIPAPNSTASTTNNPDYAALKELNGTFVTVGYTNTPMPGANHTYIILEDASGKASVQYATRAGPLNTGSGKMLYAQGGNYPSAGFPDKPSETIYSQYVGYIPYPFERVVTNAGAYERTVNDLFLDYQNTSQNSNTYTFTYLDRMGLPRPEPIGWTPGADETLPVPIFTKGP